MPAKKIALVGRSIALALGVLAGTSLGALLDWRMVFGLISPPHRRAGAVGGVEGPGLPGQTAEWQAGVLKGLLMPGVRPECH